MKMLVTTLLLAIIIREIHCDAHPAKPRQTKRIGDTVNWYTAKQGLINAFVGVRSKVGNALVNVKRLSMYTSKRFVSWLADRDFILEKNDAAYFFEEEQKARDQAIAFMEEELRSSRQKRDAVRQNFQFKNIFMPWKWNWSVLGMVRSVWRSFRCIMLNRKIGKMKDQVMAARDVYNPEILCDDPDPTALERNCRMALDNDKLQDRLSLTFIADAAMGPVCEMKSVEVPETGFRSERKFLRCLVEAYNRRRFSPVVMRTYAYISSIENPSEYRMRYYLFMSPDQDLTVDPPPEYVSIPQPYPHPGSYPPNYPALDPRNPPDYVMLYDPLNPHPYPFPTMYVPPYESSNAPPSTKNSPPHETKNGSQITYLPYPVTDSLHMGQQTPSAPPQSFSNSLHPTIDSPPREGGKSSRAPSSPPSPMSEDAKSKSTSPKKKKLKAKIGLSWRSNGNKTKEGPERPIQIVTLAINKDFRALDKKKKV